MCGFVHVPLAQLAGTRIRAMADQLVRKRAADAFQQQRPHGVLQHAAVLDLQDVGRYASLVVRPGMAACPPSSPASSPKLR